MFWMVGWTRKMKNSIDARRSRIITGSDKIIEIFIKKGYNEGIERQLKVLAYVRQTMDVWMIGRRMQDVSERYKDLPNFCAAKR